MFSSLSCSKTMNIYSLVNAELNNHSINNEITKSIVKTYSGMENSGFIKEEVHAEYNNGLVVNIIFFNAIPSFEKEKKYTTEKTGDIRCYYDRKKLTKRVDSFKNSEDELIISTTNYSYLDKTSAIYETYKENELELNAKITLTNERQAEIVINYVEDENRTVTFFKEFDEQQNKTKLKEEYFENGKLKTESYSYQYKDQDLHIVKSSDYEMRYEYVYDDYGNWIKCVGYKNGEVVELFVRELTYK